MRQKPRGTCDNCVSSVCVLTREAAAKARITGRDDKTVLSRAFEIPTKQQNRLLHLLLRVSSAILQICFVKHDDKHSYTTVKR